MKPYEITIGKLYRKNLASELMLTVEFYDKEGVNTEERTRLVEVMFVQMGNDGWDIKGVIEIAREPLFIWQRQ
jgi:hypothetical protein